MRRAVLAIAVAAVSSLLAMHAEGSERARFTALDETLVRVFFHERPIVWTGLAPDLRRAYGRGKPLPVGPTIAALPDALLVRLPKRSGMAYARVGEDVVLYDVRTRIVSDVIERVFS